MAKHILLIDGNSLAHAAHNGPTLTVGPMQVQAIFIFLKTLRSLLETIQGDLQPVVLWDGKAQHRIELYPEYKGNRRALDAKQQAHKEAFRAQTPFLEMALKLLGITQMRSPIREADDLAGYWTRELAPGRPITMVSGDRDWIQLVNEWVSWFDPINDRRVDSDNFFEFTGYETPQGYIDGKALTGDSSDNVPGIKGLGDKGAQLLIAAHGSVESFLAKVDAGTYAPKKRASATAATPHPEQVLASEEGRAVYRRNVALMDLVNTPAPAPGELITVRQPPNVEAFERLCARLNFASITRQMPQFLRAFGIHHTPAALAA